MHICHIITTLVYGGAERLLVEVTNQHIYDHQIDIIYFKDEPHLQARLDPRIHVHLVPLNRNTPRALRTLLHRLQPDIVHTHLGHADFIGLWASRGMACRHFCTMHNIHWKWDWRDNLIFAGYTALLRFVVSDCRVIAISQSVANHVRQRLHVPADRVEVVYNAIPEVALDRTKAELRAALDIPADAFCILFVGRLHLQKSIDTLLRAVAGLDAHLSDVVLLIVGEGPQRTELTALCAELGLAERVRFCGVTPHPEEYLAAADLFILPSVTEGLGLVILEAFRASVPVIASNIEGPAELITPYRDGLLFPPRDVAALAHQIKLLYFNPELRRRIGMNGYQRYYGQFTIEVYARRLADLYEA